MELVIYSVCYTCFRYGHVSSNCRSKARRIRCGESKHLEPSDCMRHAASPVCLNCRGDHFPTSAACPTFQKHRLIQTIASVDNIPLAEARAKVGNAAPIYSPGGYPSPREFPSLPSFRVNSHDHSYSRAPPSDFNNFSQFSDSNPFDLLSQSQDTDYDAFDNPSRPSFADVAARNPPSKSSYSKGRTFNNFTSKRISVDERYTPRRPDSRDDRASRSYDRGAFLTSQSFHESHALPSNGRWPNTSGNGPDTQPSSVGVSSSRLEDIPPSHFSHHSPLFSPHPFSSSRSRGFSEGAPHSDRGSARLPLHHLHQSENPLLPEEARFIEYLNNFVSLLVNSIPSSLRNSPLGEGLRQLTLSLHNFNTPF